jgi:hypothetical protein
MTRITGMTAPASPQNVPAHLADLSSKCAALANRITGQIPRSDVSTALANFCKYVGGELTQMSRFYPENVLGLVWATRNIFETFDHSTVTHTFHEHRRRLFLRRL